MFLLLFGEGGLLVNGGAHNDKWFFYYTPSHKKVAGYYVIPSEPFERPSVSASFPDSNLSRFWSIFFKFGMDIDIREE